MKKALLALLAIGIFTIATAQEQFSFGLVGTRFSNTDNNNKLTEIENPVGYGVILGYAVNENLTIALTGEYFQDDMENSLGEETDYRAHLSAYFMPLEFNSFRPYISAGMVFTNRNYDYIKNADETDNLLGFYTDGLKFVGWTSSIGLRYGLNF